MLCFCSVFLLSAFKTVITGSLFYRQLISDIIILDTSISNSRFHFFPPLMLFYFYPTICYMLAVGWVLELKKVRVTFGTKIRIISSQSI